MGKRGLAGSMIFTLFDRAALYNIMRDKDGRFDYYAHEGEEYTLDGNNNVWDWANNLTEQIRAGGGIGTDRRHAEYMDQIMPINVTLIAQNEYGLAAWKAILGIELLNEGGGLIDKWPSLWYNICKYYATISKEYHKKHIGSSIQIKQTYNKGNKESKISNIT